MNKKCIISYSIQIFIRNTYSTDIAYTLTCTLLISYIIVIITLMRKPPYYINESTCSEQPAAILQHCIENRSSSYKTFIICAKAG